MFPSDAFCPDLHAWRVDGGDTVAPGPWNDGGAGLRPWGWAGKMQKVKLMGLGGADLGDGKGISWDSESLYLEQINIKYSPWPEAGLFFFLKTPCYVSS